MPLDIFIIAIIVFSMARGLRAGFVYTILRAISWLVVIVFSIFAYPFVIRFLSEQVDFYSTLKERLVLRFYGHLSARTDVLPDGVPHAIENAVDKISDAWALSIAESVAVACFNIAVFLLLILSIKLFIFLIARVFSRRARDGVLGKVDSFLGLLAGGAKGMIIVYIFLAFLLPLSLFISESAHTLAVGALFSSTFAKELYDNNLVLLVISGFLDM
jgi:uncharacterized membrane protein required for colicin V production